MNRLFLFCALLLVGAMVGSTAVYAVERYPSHNYAVRAELLRGSDIDVSSLVGRPDGERALLYKLEDTVRLDMREVSSRDLVIWYQLFATSTAQVEIAFLNADEEQVWSLETQLLLGRSQQIFYEGEESYRYVDLILESIETVEIDAVGLLAPVDDDVRTSRVWEAYLEDPAAPIPVTHGDLITLPDDGNDQTQYDQTVYFIGSDGLRHPFPNRVTFESWGFSFDDILHVNRATLHEHELGVPVPVKPGAYLLKTPSEADVFVVTDTYQLVRIPNEIFAIDMLGPAWADDVLDVSPIFFVRYDRSREFIQSINDVPVQQMLWPY